MRPEHNFSLKCDDWERAVFDNADHFSAVTVFGGGRREREEFQELHAAINYAKERIRTCVYAIAGERSIVLDRSKWDQWLTRYEQTHATRSPQGGPHDH
jgi:hypothetical protein